jgi:hypothetical protein
VVDAALQTPRWYPSSTAIYRHDGPNWQLVRLIDGASEIAWSPNARHLASIDDYTELLWVAQATGDRAKRIGWGFAFDWPPDSSALPSRHAVKHRSDPLDGASPVVIWTIDAATAQHHQIWPPRGSCRCGDPHWQPR